MQNGYYRVGADLQVGNQITGASGIGSGRQGSVLNDETRWCPTLRGRFKVGTGVAMTEACDSWTLNFTFETIPWEGLGPEPRRWDLSLRRVGDQRASADPHSGRSGKPTAFYIADRRKRCPVPVPGTASPSSSASRAAGANPKSPGEGRGHAISATGQGGAPISMRETSAVSP